MFIIPKCEQVDRMVIPFKDCTILVILFPILWSLVLHKCYLYWFPSSICISFDWIKTSIDTRTRHQIPFWVFGFFFINDCMDNQSILGIVDLNKEVYSILLLNNSLSETTFNKICLDLYIDHSIILILLFGYENAMLPFGKFIS